MPDEIPISALKVEISKRITKRLEDNVARLAIYLVQLMHDAYRDKFTVNDAGGAADSLTFEIERTKNFISLQFGSSKANSYLANLEWGERGTRGGTGTFQRHKAPPIKNIYDWIRRSGLSIPKWAIEMAEANQEKQAKGEFLDPHKPWYSATDPILMWASWIAVHRKQYGIAGLRVIERVLTEQKQKIEEYLSLP